MSQQEVEFMPEIKSFEAWSNEELVEQFIKAAMTFGHLNNYSMAPDGIKKKKKQELADLKKEVLRRLEKALSP